MGDVEGYGRIDGGGSLENVSSGVEEEETECREELTDAVGFSGISSGEEQRLFGNASLSEQYSRQEAADERSLEREKREASAVQATERRVRTTSILAAMEPSDLGLCGLIDERQGIKIELGNRNQRARGGGRSEDQTDVVGKGRFIVEDGPHLHDTRMPVIQSRRWTCSGGSQHTITAVSDSTPHAFGFGYKSVHKCALFCMDLARGCIVVSLLTHTRHTMADAPHFVTLGMFIIDEFSFCDEDGRPTGQTVPTQESWWRRRDPCVRRSFFV